MPGGLRCGKHGIRCYNAAGLHIHQMTAREVEDACEQPKTPVVRHLLRFGITPVFLLCAVFCAIMGPAWLTWLLIATVLFMTVGDEYVGDTSKDSSDAPAKVLNMFMYSALPLLVVLSAFLATFVSNYDPFGLIRLCAFIGVDLASVRADAHPAHIASATLLIGIFYGSSGTNIAHNLFHRTQSAFDVMVGRWLLAFSFDTTFAIEHVYGHHRNIGTLEDPATARRGETLYAFWFRSTVQQVINAVKFEAARLKRRNKPPYGIGNRALRGQFMSFTIIGAFYYAAGWTGVGLFLCAALVGKMFLESVNYIEHYGLVRVPGAKVEARHSWDSNRLLSNAVLFNLPRHSAHHLNAKLEFWQLQNAKGAAPVLPMGYLSMVFVALFPPLWRKVMRPHLKRWDQCHANNAERALITERGWHIT